MSVIKVFAVFVVALLAFPSYAAAEKDISNGNGFLAYCSKKGADEICALYLSGVEDGFRTGSIRGVAAATMAAKHVAYEEGKYGLGTVIKNKEACQTFLAWATPEGVTGRQTVAVILKWLKDNPEQRHLETAEIVVMALSQAWPVPLSATIGDKPACPQ